jgi:predicted porin
MQIQSKLAGVALSVLLAAPPVHADEVSELKAQLQSMQQQMNVLQQQLHKITEKVEHQSTTDGFGGAPVLIPAVAKTAELSAVAPPSGADNASGGAEGGHGFFERKPGERLTFYTPGGELTVYANIDLSLDTATKGLGGKLGPDGNPPVGMIGWLPDISTNLSYIGVRGFQTLKNLPFNFIYQLETQIDIAATSGTGESNSNESNSVKGALTSRNSFVGFSSRRWGSIMLGKTDAPYKTSTNILNPFSAMIGDYQVIMANTGGDNRVEFGTRLDHSIWYQSPLYELSRGGNLNFIVLFSPGQNRADNSDNLAAGESDCTGGNVPGSGGITPVTCSDGSFSDVVSAGVSYSRGHLYLTGAYERHEKVNRSSDIIGIYGSANPYSQLLVAQDTADEDAGKIAAQYVFHSGTSLGGIFETLHRYVPQDLEFQNERQRLGTWLVASHPLTRTLSLHFGWAHAFRTPGDPGQHNDSLITPPGGVPGTDFTAGANAGNRSNMFTVALKRQLTKSLNVYANWALTDNGPAAHYDLGAGGRAVTTDCHDAFDSTGGLVASNPHCWTGGKLMGLSLGMNWKL